MNARTDMEKAVWAATYANHFVKSVKDATTLARSSANLPVEGMRSTGSPPVRDPTVPKTSYPMKIAYIRYYMSRPPVTLRPAPSGSLQWIPDWDGDILSVVEIHARNGPDIDSDSGKIRICYQPDGTMSDFRVEVWVSDPSSHAEFDCTYVEDGLRIKYHYQTGPEMEPLARDVLSHMKGITEASEQAAKTGRNR